MDLVAVSLVVGLLALSQFASALACLKTPVYNATIANPCAKTEDNYIYWPNYQNANEYISCKGIGHPVLVSCLPNYVFDFVRQACTLCARYIPAPPCQALKGKTCNAFKPLLKPTPKVASTTKPFCSTLATYSTSFKPTCLGNDDFLLWPNYKNMSEYYICQGKYNPLIAACESGLYFNFPAQRCTNCASYIAAPVCSKLPFHKSNKCLKL